VILKCYSRETRSEEGGIWNMIGDRKGGVLVAWGECSLHILHYLVQASRELIAHTYKRSCMLQRCVVVCCLLL
jgi:hypothetical protein